MAWWLLSALVLQGADGAYACRQLSRHGQPHSQGGLHMVKELNPLLPGHCGGVLLVKSAGWVPLLFLEPDQRRWYVTGLAISGGVGFGLSIVLSD